MCSRAPGSSRASITGRSTTSVTARRAPARPAASLGLSAGAAVALVDHPRAERPGLDQLERDVVGDGWQERRAATDDERVAEHAQLVDEAELDRLGGQAGPADRDVIAHQTSAKAALSSFSRNDGAVS